MNFRIGNEDEKKVNEIIVPKDRNWRYQNPSKNLIDQEVISNPRERFIYSRTIFTVI